MKNDSILESSSFLLKPAHWLMVGLLVLAVGAASLMACGGGDDDSSGQQSAKTDNANRNDATQNAALARLEMPHVKGGHSFVIVHTALLNKNSQLTGINYCTEWDPDIRAQRWSCYQLFGKDRGPNVQLVSRYYVKGSTPGITPESQYPNDPFIDEDFQFTSDPYWGSGYDHGHICPSADRLASNEANYQTFFLTNMQPQVNAFNGGIWERMETKVRNWAANVDTLYVCKGGTIDRDDYIVKTLGSGPNKIPVPKYFFMALLAKNSMGYKALGFWIEHDGSIDKETPLGQFVVNIQELERKTGIDFFCNLPDDVEQEVERLDVDRVKKAWGL